MTEKQKTFDNLIADVNEILTNDAKKICELINSYKKNPIKAPTEIELEIFDKVVPFEKDPEDGTEFKKALSNRKGVYIFLITSFINIDGKFNRVYYGAKLNDINISSFNTGDILYVGKAKSFLRRMHQHFSAAKEDNKTGSLKILSKEREKLVGHFTIYAFCIKLKYKDFYDIIASTVEKEIRKELKPLVGV